jgi:hypothetical protein
MVHEQLTPKNKKPIAEGAVGLSWHRPIFQTLAQTAGSPLPGYREWLVQMQVVCPRRISFQIPSTGQKFFLVLI